MREALNMFGETVINWNSFKLDNKRLLAQIKKILAGNNVIENGYCVHKLCNIKKLPVSQIISTATSNCEHTSKSNVFSNAVDYEVRSTTTEPEAAQMWFRANEKTLKFVCHFLLENHCISLSAAQKIITTYVKSQPRQSKFGLLSSAYKTVFPFFCGGSQKSTSQVIKGSYMDSSGCQGNSQIF